MMINRPLRLVWLPEAWPIHPPTLRLRRHGFDIRKSCRCTRMRIQNGLPGSVGISICPVTPRPPMGSILNLKTIPPTGGDTLCCSMYAAYDACRTDEEVFCPN